MRMLYKENTNTVNVHGKNHWILKRIQKKVHVHEQKPYLVGPDKLSDSCMLFSYNVHVHCDFNCMIFYRNRDIVK